MDSHKQIENKNDNNKILGNVEEFTQSVNIVNEGVKEDNRKKISQKSLINKLNFINFQERTVIINLEHNKLNRLIYLYAKPQPCFDKRLNCQWVDANDIEKILKSYKFKNLVVTDGHKLILVKPELKTIDNIGLSLILPEQCFEAGSRKAKRNSCENLKVQMIQNSAPFFGNLIDFSGVSFRVKINTEPPQTFQWINSEATVNIIFSNNNETLYSGECKIIKQSWGKKSRTFILEPLNQQIPRFKPKEFRSTRQELVPLPNIIFKHPFTGKIIDLKIIDISGSGFSVEEEVNKAVLLPGMIIHTLELSFANSFKIKCMAQVVYRKVFSSDHEEDRVKLGLAVLDMDIEDHMKLSSVLHQAEDKNSYICNKMDMDSLWSFFFETGFIYPKKYEFIQANKKKIKENYEKLYTQNPNIARHFIYQDKGVILGHMSMLLFYENSWMIHHHAAHKSAAVKAGLSVLNQIGRFTYDVHRLHSSHMDFLFCYFRPDNKFPNEIFGGAAKKIADPRGCSIDSFAYCHIQRSINGESELSTPWELTETDADDLMTLESFYENESGGLMIHAMDLDFDSFNHNKLTQEYNKLGFRRERHLFSLKKDNNLRAIIMLNISDTGLNMSDLTNCLKVFVLDPDDLPKEVLFSSISSILKQFKIDEMPILIYPVSYPEAQSITFEKIYNLWILNAQYSDHYFRFLNTLNKITQH